MFLLRTWISSTKESFLKKQHLCLTKNFLILRLLHNLIISASPREYLHGHLRLGHGEIEMIINSQVKVLWVHIFANLNKELSIFTLKSDNIDEVGEYT